MREKPVLPFKHSGHRRKITANGPMRAPRPFPGERRAPIAQQQSSRRRSIDRPTHNTADFLSPLRNQTCCPQLTGLVHCPSSSLSSTASRGPRPLLHTTGKCCIDRAGVPATPVSDRGEPHRHCARPPPLSTWCRHPALDLPQTIAAQHRCRRSSQPPTRRPRR